MLKRLDEGDVLVVTRLDRLARSTRDLLNILDTVAKAGAGFRSLADAWADTTTPGCYDDWAFGLSTGPVADPGGASFVD